MRRDNTRLVRYRMQEEELLAAARRAVELGFRTVVLQSGEGPWWSPRRLAGVIKEIKSWGVAVTLSVGELEYRDYLLLKEAGADRYLLRHETADPLLFAQMKPDTTMEKRQRCLWWLKELGYETGAGCIVGLPGQTLESLVEDLLFMQELQPEMAGIGPFIPHPDTPLAQAPPGSPLLALKVLALTRLILPGANLPATTATAVASRGGREAALLCGANVVMPDITPLSLRVHYEIYPGKGQADLEKDPYRYWQEKLESLGRVVGQDVGGQPPTPFHLD